MKLVNNTMKSTSHFAAAIAILISSAAMSTDAVAQGKSPAEDSKAKATDWSAFLCKDIMRMSGDERIISLSLLNGYFLGKRGGTSVPAGAMGKASDDFTEYCLDNPQAKALEAFGRFAKF